MCPMEPNFTKLSPNWQSKRNTIKEDRLCYDDGGICIKLVQCVKA